MQGLNGFVTMSDNTIYEFNGGEIRELNNDLGYGLYVWGYKDLETGTKIDYLECRLSEFGGLFPFFNQDDNEWFIVELRFVF